MLKQFIYSTSLYIISGRNQSYIGIASYDWQYCLNYNIHIGTGSAFEISLLVVFSSFRRVHIIYIPDLFDRLVQTGCSFPSTKGLYVSFEGRYVYWSPEEVPDLEIKMIDNKQFIPPHADYLTLGAAGIATSYALLLHLARGQFEISRPIAHWLVEYPTSGYLVRLALVFCLCYWYSVFIFLHIYVYVNIINLSLSLSRVCVRIGDSLCH